MNGVVKWFKNKKGFGYIIGADGETYLFELIDCINPNEEFNAGDKVIFIPVFGELESASKVEKVPNE